MREEALGDLEPMMEISGLARMSGKQSEDAGLAVRFTIEPQQNEEKSKQAGRPVFDDVEMCEIRIAGSPDMIREVVSGKHTTRFPRQYEAFKRGLDQDVASGTPLHEWPLLLRSQVEEARHFGVRTVEQLAALTDPNVQHLGAGWMSLRQKARDWLEAATKGALLGKLRSELEDRDRRINTLEKMVQQQSAELSAVRNGMPVAAPSGPDPVVAQLAAQVAALTAAMAAKPKRGRPPKAKEQ